MKIKRHESYSLEGLSKDELIFLLELVEKAEPLISADSSPLSLELARKFKEFSASLEVREEAEDSIEIAAPEPPPPVPLECDGCETKENVSIQIDPTSGLETALCPDCYTIRKGYVE